MDQQASALLLCSYTLPWVGATHPIWAPGTAGLSDVRRKADPSSGGIRRVRLCARSQPRVHPVSEAPRSARDRE